jgi:hypothetical protein
MVWIENIVSRPMMDWSESSIFSASWRAAFAKRAHQKIKENQRSATLSQ